MNYNEIPVIRPLTGYEAAIILTSMDPEKPLPWRIEAKLKAIADTNCSRQRDL